MGELEQRIDDHVSREHEYPPDDMGKEISFANSQVIINTIITKKAHSVFKGFVYPYSNVKSWITIRPHPHCFACGKKIEMDETIALGIATKGTNSTFCVPCVKEFKAQGADVKERVSKP